MFPWSNSSVSLAETARRNTLKFVETRKKTIELLADRFFTSVARDIDDYSSKNSVPGMSFNITDSLVTKKVIGLSDTTHQERYDILKKVVEKLQEEKLVCRTDGTVLHVSWEYEKPTEHIIFFYDKNCPHCAKLIPIWTEIASKLYSKGCATSVDVRDPSYKSYSKPVTAVPAVRVYPKGFGFHEEYVESIGDSALAAMTEFANTH